MERSDAVRRVRSRLRPVRLAGRAAAKQAHGWTVASREGAYSASQRLSGSSPWSITSDSVALAWFRGLPNFGDEISPMIVEHMTGRRPRWVSPDFHPKVVAVGSLLAYARPSDVIIGTGAIRPERMPLPKGAQVLALRGPRTADMLGLAGADVAFGDPGLLAARALGVRRSAGSGSIGVVPHYVDHQEAARLLGNRPSVASETVVVDVRSGPRSVIEAISRVDVCVSTSLHGLIVAESLGVPAIWASISDGITGGTFKFNDYYEGTGRSAREPSGFHEALELAASGDTRPFVPDTAPIEGAFARLAGLLG